MAYGLKVYDASFNIRLDTTDREFRYVAFYTGSVSASSSTNVSVSGLTNDGTHTHTQTGVRHVHGRWLGRHHAQGV